MRYGLGAVVAVGLLVGSACNCGDPAAVGKPDGGPVVQEVVPCKANADCPFGQVCLAGQCVVPTALALSDAGLCQTDQDCPDLRYVCAVSTGQCLRVPNRCLSDADCAADARCDLATVTCRTALDAGVEPPCLEGEVRSCGPSKVGECRFGRETCQGGVWGACVGAVVPAAEICNGMDDDCDGLVDEDYDLSSDPRNCGQCGQVCLFANATGLCQASRCVRGPCDPGWVDANGDPADGCEYRCDPTNGGVEICDGLDNNCDGKTDEGFDQDGDGFTTCQGDCDDANPNVNPDAKEICNARDDDCDGLTDEGFDLDGDGFTTCEGDCDDLDPTVHPGAFEVCDGKDQDCNGLVDENLGTTACGVGTCVRSTANCIGGVSQVCQPGTPRTEICDGLDDDCDGQTDEGLGSTTCGAGSCQRTTANCLGGVAQTCQPGAPTVEVCDGVDNDCNGLTDEDLGSTTCGTGACQRTTANCIAGVVQNCEEGAPGAEVCNGLDDDCDGVTDEQLGSTTCGAGACQRTLDNCVAGVPQTCQPGSPSAEICDGLDNDCNGQTDENLGSTSCGIGSCLRSTGNCVAGKVQTCQPGSPVAEVCNGLDDDCDGRVDDGLGSTTCGTGACRRSTANCVAGVVQTCEPGTPNAEICNGIDDDCDGQTDEDLGTSTCGLGACQRTTANCVAGKVQTCQPGGPSAEVCDGVDNDCNGLTDEGLGSTTCGVGACQRTTANCVAGVPQTCTPGAATGELCDLLDNDCDGQTDEDLGTTTCGAGICQRTVANCVSGLPVTCEPGAPATETCNGLDDNCNGQTDEGLGSTTCGTGACQHTASNCVAGVVQTCQASAPSAEVCDGVDNDCNGQTDEGLGSTTCGIGQCQRTNPNCTGGHSQACQPGAPGTETCDGLDDNCDGRTDENITRFVQDGSQQNIEPVYGPVDIIFVVANNGTMNEEILAVENNINDSFATFLTTHGLDYRVIMLSKYGAATSSYALCVRPPLGGSSSCGGTCPVNTARFFHYNVDLGAHDSLYQVVTTYNAPDPCGKAPGGWSQWLRPGVPKVFIEITDNGPTSGSPSQPNAYTADSFESRLFALSPAVFGTAQNRAYKFHSIVGLLENTPTLDPWLPADPLVDARCTGNGGYVQQPGLEYQTLSKRTGALRYPICQYQSFDAVFQAVAKDILLGSEMSCQFQLHSVPSDSGMDNTLLELAGSSGARVLLTHVPDAASCSGQSFYTEGSVIKLCQDACTLWRTDPSAHVEVLFTCTRQVP
jgi:hypothetical protein